MNSVWHNHLSGEIFVEFAIHDNQLWVITLEDMQQQGIQPSQFVEAVTSGKKYSIIGKTLNVNDGELIAELSYCHTTVFIPEGK